MHERMYAREKDQNVLFWQLMFMKHLLCARLYQTVFTYILLFHLYIALWGNSYSYAHTTDQ